MKRIAIIGAGPSGLFLYKRFLETGRQDFSIDIFEAKEQLAAGMPYSEQGANPEHITNVSGNEIPRLNTSLKEWISHLPKEKLEKFSIDPDHFNDYHVLPRLLFGEYLAGEFNSLLEAGMKKGLQTNLHLKTKVTDIREKEVNDTLIVDTDAKQSFEFDQVIICIGHQWPLTEEGKKPGYFDSPYPPAKLRFSPNHPVAIRGSSLTAIDAIRTLARSNGSFKINELQKITYYPNPQTEKFKIVMHSRQGLLPGVRFHLEDPRLSNDSLLSKKEIEYHMKVNGGFLSLDFIFEKDFIEPIRDKEPAFYEMVKNMKLEEFVDKMMSFREQIAPFELLKAEYAEAAKSIRTKKSVYWKEMLAVLSFAMNYPAKHFSAEDMLRLQKVLMPLISIIIAFVPQSSCEELIALHEAGKLEIISVGEDSEVIPHPEAGIQYRFTDEKGISHEENYLSFVDCIGQRHLMLEDFPFRSLAKNGSLTGARLRFRSAEEAKAHSRKVPHQVEEAGQSAFYLKVPGIAINDQFRAIKKNGSNNPKIHIMSVAYIGGYNPDYSGIDFCEEASKIIVDDILPG